MDKTNEITKTMTEELIDATQRLYYARRRNETREQLQRVYDLCSVLSSQKLLSLMSGCLDMAYICREDESSCRDPFTVIANSCEIILMNRHIAPNRVHKADDDVKHLLYIIMDVFYSGSLD